MTLTEFLTHFPDHKQAGKGYQARCPAHDDRTASLSISLGDKGGILIHCFAGCDKEAILAAAHLSLKDLAPPKPNGQKKAPIIKIYDYGDEQGELLFQSCRRSDKSFSQRQPDGKGGWIWKMEGVRSVLYRLKELLQADPQQWVFVVEGEKDTDNLWAAGLIATTNVGGAGKWKPEYAAFLEGRKVCILPDNDDPGRKHAQQVAASLLGKAAEVKVLELPGLPEKGDVSDWLRNNPADCLVAYADEAPEWVYREREREREPEREPEENDYHWSDLGNAQRLIDRHGKNLRYCHLWERWLVWDGQRWAIDQTSEVFRLAQETIDSIYIEAAHLSGEKRRDLMKFALKSEAKSRIDAMVGSATRFEQVRVLPHELDRDPHLLNLNNGTLNLLTGELQPHCQKDLITKIAPVEYDSEAEAPLWMEFLQKIMSGNEEMIGFLQRAGGYALTADVSEQVIFILYGTGANGKSTYLDTLRTLWGDYGLSTPTDTLTLRKGEPIPNDLARLQGSRLVTAVETEEGKRLAESRIKQMTSKELLVARFLHREFFEFPPTFKIFLATNHKPAIKGTDKAIWRRLKLLPFLVYIPEEEQDKHFTEKLLQELPGILNWLLFGCIIWRKIGLGVPPEVAEATEEYRSEQDTLAAFLGEHCQLGPRFEVFANHLYAEYTEWCRQNGETAEKHRTFSAMLSERGFKKYRSTGNMVRWKGIGLIDEREE